jgi:YHS domain-containing protein
MGKLILWGILIVILIRALMRLARVFTKTAGYTRRGDGPPSVGLVKDPVCGVFVPRSQALTVGSGGEARFFCSEKCRSEWTRRR